MSAKLNQNFKLLVLLSFYMLFFLKSFTGFSFSKIDAPYILIESTEESEPESNEKLTEGTVECEDFSHHSIFMLFVNFNKNIHFLFYNFHWSFSYIEGIELPPES